MTNDTTNGPGIDRQGTDHPGEMQKTAKSATKTVQNDLKTAADELKKDAGKVAETVKEEAAAVGKQAEGMANEQKNAIAAHLDGVAGAIRKAAEGLESEHNPGARATREAANRVSQLATALKDNDVGDLIGMAEDFGRKQPVAFLGASMLAGFAASRFLVASGHRSQTGSSTTSQSQGYRPQQSSPAQAGTQTPVSPQQGGTL